MSHWFFHRILDLKNGCRFYGGLFYLAVSSNGILPCSCLGVCFTAAGGGKGRSVFDRKIVVRIHTPLQVVFLTVSVCCPQSIYAHSSSLVWLPGLASRSVNLRINEPIRGLKEHPRPVGSRAFLKWFLTVLPMRDILGSRQ